MAPQLWAPSIHPSRFTLLPKALTNVPAVLTRAQRLPGSAGLVASPLAKAEPLANDAAALTKEEDPGRSGDAEAGYSARNSSEK